LGLDPALAGSASLVALVFDAVSDPFVGLWSDRYNSKRWGRRHPFMLWSALPLGLFTYVLFQPPAGIGQIGLFIWLTVFSILVRIALPFLVVPHISLGAELTEDYNERTSVTAYRIMFAALVSPIVMIIGFTQFFENVDGANGMFNAAAYPRFALFCAVLMVGSILIMIWGTRQVIPSLPPIAKDHLRPSFGEMFKGFRVAVRMKSFVSLVGYMMIVYVGLGIGIILTTYFMTYFFELTESEMALLPIGSAVGALFALGLAPRMSKRYDKKKGAILSTILFALFFTAPFILRLLGLFPDNHTPLLLPSYVSLLTIAYGFLWVAMSLGTSMMADVVDEYEVISGLRQ
jgi:Na+/melibiose symporter-like transporter